MTRARRRAAAPQHAGALLPWGLVIAACVVTAACAGRESDGVDGQGGAGAGASGSSADAGGAAALGGAAGSGGPGRPGAGGSSMGGDSAPDGGSGNGEGRPPDGGAVSRDGASPSADRSTFGFGGPSKCPGVFAICEDFESAADGELPEGWTREGTWALATATAEKARGAKSLQVQVGVTNNERGFLLKTRAQLGALAVKHFGRMFLKLKSPPTKFVHWDFFHGVGRFGGVSNDVRWGVAGTEAFSYLFNVQPSSGSEFGANDSRKLVIDDWTCAEWLLDSSAQGGGEARFWIDGTELTQLHRVGTQARIPVFERMGIGWELFIATDTPSIAYIDEVVFDGARVGCNN